MNRMSSHDCVSAGVWLQMSLCKQGLQSQACLAVSRWCKLLCALRIADT